MRVLTKVTAVATLLLIFIGSLVTSTGSGLAVPDWPLSFGGLFPPMVGGILYEHGHRVVAAFVGLLIVIQAVVLTRRQHRIAGTASVSSVGWPMAAAVGSKITPSASNIVFRCFAGVCLLLSRNG